MVPDSGYETLPVPAHTWLVLSSQTAQTAQTDDIQQLWAKAYGEWFPANPPTAARHRTARHRPRRPRPARPRRTAARGRTHTLSHHPSRSHADITCLMRV
ncbi:GyrI-like domain-containing protein [Saccharopolyspora sp. NPDC049357]|uniref:GyrI-like domain-containing protein n=1 Tax=Saccharopolyspora sp. NPDC049357 TaxID=3154507 RepID=UPI003422811A